MDITLRAFMKAWDDGLRMPPDEAVSPQGDGDPGPMRMTLAEQTSQKVWILWRNDRLLCVCGTYDRAWTELHELMKAIGGVWIHHDHARVWGNESADTTLRIEAREVHR